VQALAVIEELDCRSNQNARCVCGQKNYMVETMFVDISNPICYPKVRKVQAAAFGDDTMASAAKHSVCRPF